MSAVLVENLKKAWHVRYPTGIVCHRFRFIFFPVPKAASSSVKKLIAQMEGLPSQGHPHHDIEFQLVWGKDLYKYPDYRTFTVVRNPWDRLVSCFKDKILGCYDTRFGMRSGIHEGLERYNQILGRRIFYDDMPFPEFINVIRKIPDSLADEHFRSQYRMFSTPSGRLLTERIIRFENLYTELTAFFEKLNIKDFNIDHLNKSAGDDYRRFYTDDLVKEVARMYEKDIKLLGYAF